MCKKKLSILLIILIIFSIRNTLSFENKIILKVDNEIITSIDILNETRTLKAMNINLDNMKSNDILEFVG